MARDVRKTPSVELVGHGKVVIGRLYTDRNMFYCSVEVDELMMWNEALTQQDVAKLFNE